MVKVKDRKINYFWKSFNTTIGIISAFILIAGIGLLSYYGYNYLQNKPLKPTKELFSQNEEVKYGYASIKIEEFKKNVCYIEKNNGLNLLERLKLREAGQEIPKEYEEKNYTTLKIKAKNSDNNPNKIYITEGQFIIKNEDKLYKPVGIDDRDLKPTIRGQKLDTGQEIVGYLFFEQVEFSDPILEFKPFDGSPPIKIKLKK